MSDTLTKIQILVEGNKKLWTRKLTSETVNLIYFFIIIINKKEFPENLTQKNHYLYACRSFTPKYIRIYYCL